MDFTNLTSVSKITDKQIKNLEFEDAIQALETIVHAMEQGEVPLKQSIDNYSTGIKLQTHCQKLLDNAKYELTKLQKNENGIVSLKTQSN